MRLMWVGIDRLGKFASAKLRVDSPVVALLGANEAGKTTVLNALALLSNDEPIDPRRIHRGADAPPDTVVTAWFLLCLLYTSPSPRDRG